MAKNVKKAPVERKPYVEKYKSNNSRTNLNDPGMAMLIPAITAV